MHMSCEGLNAHFVVFFGSICVYNFFFCESKRNTVPSAKDTYRKKTSKSFLIKNFPYQIWLYIILRAPRLFHHKRKKKPKMKIRSFYGYLNQLPACYIAYIFKFILYFMQLRHNTEHIQHSTKKLKSTFFCVLYSI